MRRFDLIKNQPKLTLYARIASASVVAMLFILTTAVYSLLQAKLAVIEHSLYLTPTVEQARLLEPFPVSVDPIAQVITTDPSLEGLVQDTVAPFLSERPTDRWLDRMLAQVSTQSWFQTLATPQSRVIIILPGERKEQVTHNLGQILGWDSRQQDTFLRELTTRTPAFPEGVAAPGRYVVPSNAQPEFVAALVNERFQRTVLNRYPADLESTLPLQDVLTLASLLDRESFRFEEQRVIAGIIWNRLFIDMPLQIDATLQYARTNEQGGNWWPVPRPADKFIDSPFNTYQNQGLPPHPIANPGVASVIAALNPIATDCLFYFHDSRRGFHCSETYEEHVRKLRIHYGQGR